MDNLHLPIPTVNITEEFDWYGENIDILLKIQLKLVRLTSKISLEVNIRMMKTVIKVENPKCIQTQCRT